MTRAARTAEASDRSRLLDELLLAVTGAFPPISAPGQRAALVVLEQLLAGVALRREKLAAVMGLPTPAVDSLLDEPGMRTQTLLDPLGRVVGFAGLGIAPTPHALHVSGRTAYTWCAWDALFLVPLLGWTATLETACPATAAVLRLRISPAGIQPTDGEMVMTFVAPHAKECAVSTEQSIRCFCDLVRVCVSESAARAWDARADMHLLTLTEAFDLGLRYNGARFGLMWRSPA